MRTKIAILLIVTFADRRSRCGLEVARQQGRRTQYRIAGWTWGEGFADSGAGD